jgi:hypothetical protein
MQRPGAGRRETHCSISGMMICIQTTSSAALVEVGSHMPASSSSARVRNSRGENLRNEFGTEEALVEAAPETPPEPVVEALTERLRTARTGREAVHGLLEIAISLRTGYRESNAGQLPKSLEHYLRNRLERSVYEGELPESANVRAMSALTFATVNGLLFCEQEDASAAQLRDSVRLFIDGLGFQAVRPLKRNRRPRPLAPILQFVKRTNH